MAKEKLTQEEKAELKAQKKAAKKAAKKNGGLKNLAAEFKAFISRGSVIDMSIGVIIGGAFGAIVTAFTGILMSVCTWYVPGGIKGLVTVLPAANDVQKGMDPALTISCADATHKCGGTVGLGQKFAAAHLQELAEAEARKVYGVQVDSTPTLIENVKATILSKYTLHGTNYTYNLSAVIDWGTFINAIISFLIIAVVLFIILKAVNVVRAKNAELKAMRLEAYYKRHPEERPVPPAPAPAKPSEVDLLIEIRDALAAKKD